MTARLSIAIVLILMSSTAHAEETWFCEYQNYRHTGTDQSRFHDEAGSLVETSGDVITSYRVLEDSSQAIVAAKGGSYSSEPWVMGFLLMIRKNTGQFVLTTSSFGEQNGTQTGHCTLDDLPRRQ